MKTERQVLIQNLLWIAVLLVSLFLSIKQRDYFQVGAYQDDASYILLAKSLVSSDQYGSVSGLDRSVIPDFPFGFPLLLSPFIILFQENYDALKIISLVATLLNVAILYWGWRWLLPGASPWWGLAVSGLYAVFPLTIRHTSMVMSEPIFTTFCLISIILTEYLVRQEKPRKIQYLLLGVALAGSFFIRTLGIALVASSLLYLWLKLKSRALKFVPYIVTGMFIIGATIILITPLTVLNLIPERYIQNDLVRIASARMRTVFNPDAVTEPTQSGVESVGLEEEQTTTPWEFVVGGFFWHIETDVRDIVMPLGGGEFEQNIANQVGFPSLPRVFGVIVSLIIIFGSTYYLARYGPNLYLLYASVYFVFLIFWVWEGQRLLYPIQPQFQFAFLFGLFSLLAAIFPVLKNKVLASSLSKILFISLVLSMMLVAIVKSYSIKNSRHHIGDMQIRTAWIRENARADAVILSGEPTTDFLYAHRQIVSFPYHVKSGPEFEDYLQAASVDYVLVAPELRWQTVYQPSYSERMTFILPYIDTLVDENVLSPVHEDTSNFIRVYQVNPIAGQ